LIFEILGVALLLCTSGFILRSFGWRGAAVFSTFAMLLLIKEAWEPLSYVFSSVKEIGEISGISEPIGAAIKILGLGYLFGMCADVCREMSESGIAKAVEVVGRVEIIAVVIPYFREIVRVGVELVG